MTLITEYGSKLPNYQNGSDDSCAVADSVVAFVTNQRRRRSHEEALRRLPLTDLQNKQKPIHIN